MTSSSKRAARPERDDQYATLAGILLLAALVIVGGASRSDAASQPFMRLASIIVIGWCTFHLTAAELRRAMAVGWFLLGFAALCVLQLIPLPPGVWAALPGNVALANAMASLGFDNVWRPLSLTPDRTLNALLACLPAAAVLLVLVRIRRSSLNSIPYALLVTVALTAVLSLSQVYGGGPYFYRITNAGNGVGFFANRNHAALLLAMGLPLTAYAAVYIARRRRAGGALLGAAASMALLLTLLLANGSRGGIAAGLIGLLGAGWIVVRSQIVAFSRARWAAAVIGASAMILGLMAAFWFTERSLTFTRLMSASEDNAELRILALPWVLQLVRDFMPFGSGLGSFEFVFRILEPDALVSPVYLNHAHNDYLELASDAGLAGIALLLALAYRTLRRGRISLRNDARNPAIPMAVILVTQIAFASLFDYPIRTPFMSALLCYALFLLLAGEGSARREDS